MRIFATLCLFACFVASSAIVTGQDSITLEKIWSDYTFANKRVPGFNFMADGQSYSRLEKNAIVRYDLLSGKQEEDIFSTKMLSASDTLAGDLDSYTFYDDEKLIMLESDKEAIYRRSSKAYYYMYNRSSKSLTPISEGNKIMYATPSPAGDMVAYVLDNNLYCLDLKTSKTKQITSDGKINEIINGSADWVYEEEFSFAKAFHWNGDGSKIAFMRFDEREVPEFTMTNYRNELYPEYVTFKYPKVGENNAVVSAHIYDIKSTKTTKIQINSAEEFYIPRIKWTQRNDKLLLYKMNRHQNNLELLAVDANSGKANLMMKETSKYYIDITDDIRFLKNGNDFIWSSEKSGYNHLYLYNLNGRELKQLTSGNYDVINFYGIDEDNNTIYYRAAEKNALEKQIYSLNLNTNQKKAIRDEAGTHSAQFSSTYDYYVDTHSTINTPPSYKVYNRKGELVRTIEDNNKLQAIQKDYGTQEVEFFDFKTKDGVTLNGWMIAPANFDKTKKHPVFMYLYGGPGSQQVVDTWKGQNYWWFQMLSQQGYLIACVDNRGTGARGEEFKKQTYLKLGDLETQDQIEAARYLADLPYTDASRIGIFGWSYGGYMSSLCLLKGNDVFKAAIAVAPVTNWRWYDSIYTERYMRTEEENPDGFANNSPINFADRLKGNYLLIHGMGDDNVHWQNSVEMANALIKANKQFDTYYYPNRNHGIFGGNTRLHLYTKMTNFLLEKL
jgi:dipeptidyl-peptidase-4